MQAWEDFLKTLEKELGFETVHKWLRSLTILRFDACNLYLEAKDTFQVLWFDEHIRSKAHAKLLNNNNKKIKVHISLANTSLYVPKKKEYQKKKEGPPFKLLFEEFNSSYNFNNFVVSEGNELTYKLLTEIAGTSGHVHATPLNTFNPIYIYGNTGSGKSHLLLSLAEAFKKKGLKTIFTRSETFTDHVVSAIRAGEMSVFRQAYRNIDALLIDDVHVFSRKGATQEEFFHTFNTLHQEGKQIVLTANCSPQELHFIEPRLVSRFEWGIVLPIKTLQGNDLEKVLEIKSQALNFPLPSKISQYLLEIFGKNPKSIIKALEALVLRLHMDSSSHSASALSLLSAKMLLADLVEEEKQTAITPNKIIQSVAEQYGIRTDDILGKSQSKDCSQPRQLAMYLCKYQLKLSFQKIGDLFSRDHSTVISSIKKIQQALDETDHEIPSIYHAILKKLTASISQ